MITKRQSLIPLSLIIATILVGACMLCGPTPKPTRAVANLAHTDSLHEKRVLGHYMTWYKTPNAYGEGCHNPHARGEWEKWAFCDHDPNTITGTCGFRDIAAVDYPLIGPYDSADPKVIEYHLLQALAADIDTFVIDYYGKDDAGGIDEATLILLDHIEAMNAQYGTDFKLALMYDEGALIDASNPYEKAQIDFAHILTHYTVSPAYLRANGKPVLLYFPKGHILTPPQLAVLSTPFSLVYIDLFEDYFPVMEGSYAWVKAEPWEADCSNWGTPYLEWYYPAFDFRALTVPTLTYGIGGVWAGFDDTGVGEGWSCVDYRCIGRQDGQVYDWTWAMVDNYNASVGLTYTVPISWVQLITLNDYMEGTTLLASAGKVDGSTGWGYKYVQQTKDHARQFKGLPPENEPDIYVAQHVFNARLASGTISNTALITQALDAFHSGDYVGAMQLADWAAGIPAPEVTAMQLHDRLIVTWQDQAEATLASGHRVYYGTSPGEYITSTTVLTGSAIVIAGVDENTNYYVAVTTLGMANPCETWYVSESWYSDEVAALPAYPAYLPLVIGCD